MLFLFYGICGIVKQKINLIAYVNVAISYKCTISICTACLHLLTSQNLIEKCFLSIKCGCLRSGKLRLYYKWVIKHTKIAQPLRLHFRPDQLQGADCCGRPEPSHTARHERHPDGLTAGTAVAIVESSAQLLVSHKVHHRRRHRQYQRGAQSRPQRGRPLGTRDFDKSILKNR